MENLNFDKPEALEEVARQIWSVSAGHAGSLIIAGILLAVSWFIAKRLASVQSKPLHLALPWHVLSLLVLVFLAGNVGFGLLTAKLTVQSVEMAADHFSNLTALRLAKLSHQHFFGYGLLFGIAAALALTFAHRRDHWLYLAMLAGFLASGADVISWWLAAYVSLGFYWLTIISGVMFGSAFLWIFSVTAFTNILSMRSQRS